MDFINQNPIFPRNARKNVGSLYNISCKTTTKILSEFINSRKSRNRRSVQKVRRYLRKHLPAMILTKLISSIIPAASDRWRFSCVSAKDLINCTQHPECGLVYHKLDTIIRLLFSEDIDTLTINMKAVQINSYRHVITSLDSVFNKEPRRLFPLLTSLVISGGSVHSDCLVNNIEDLAKTIKKSCSKLQNLHFPISSNEVFLSVSDIQNLRAFITDRTKHFNKEGLYHLCHPESESRKSLKKLHIGVFKHNKFEKQDVAVFFKCMNLLEDFTMLDRDRMLVKVDGSNTPGNKVLVYSVFKKTIRDCEDDNELFVSNMREMSVVDRSLKPHYLLESAPHLTRLTMDWQQELCFPPFNRYKSDWFSEMIRSNSWVMLATRLTKLDITFPSSHSINSYSLTLGDFTQLMSHLHNLIQLRLDGAGQGGPVPLIPILK